MLGPIKNTLNDDKDENSIDTPLLDTTASQPIGSESMPDYGATVNQLFGSAPSVPEQNTEQIDAKYSRYFEELKQNNIRVLKQNLSLASMNDADQQAEIKRLSLDSGLPPEMIKNNMQQVKRMVDLQKIDADKLAVDSPVLAAQLRNPEFANLAYDDIEHLSKYESLVSGTTLLFRSAAAGVPEFTGAAYDVLGSVPGTLNEIYKYATGSDATPLRVAADYLHEIADSQRALADWTQGNMSGYSAEAQSAYSGIRSMGAMAPSMYAFLVTGNPAFIYGGAGVNAAGASIGTGLDESLSESEALVYGLTDGGIEILTEMVPALRLFKDLKTGAPLFKTLMNQFMIEVPQEQLATVFQDFNAWSTLPSSKDKTFGDYLKERPPAAWHTLIATLSGTGAQTSLTYAGQKLLQRFDMNAIDPQLQTFIENSNKAQDAQTVVSKINELSAALQESKLNERSKESMYGFIKELFQSQNEQGNTPENVLIYAQDLIQYASDQGIKVTDISDVIAPQIDEAITTGGFVSFPIETYLTEIANSEHGLALNEMLRLNENAMSVAEANEWSEQANQDLIDQADTIIQQMPDKESSEVIYEAIVAQLVESGVPREEANKNATLYRAFFTVMGDRAGIDPMQLFERYGLNVQRVMPEGLQDITKSEQANEFIGAALNALGLSGQDVRSDARPPVDPDRFDLPEHMWNIKIKDDSVLLHTQKDADGNVTKVWVTTLQGGNEGLKRADFDSEADWAKYQKVQDEFAERKSRGRDLIQQLRDTANQKEITTNQKEIFTQQEVDSLRSFVEADLGFDITQATQQEVAQALSNAFYDPQGRVLNQSALHGTGLSKVFDRFSMDYLGSGEGAQAFGYGLYFTTSQGIAEHYRAQNSLGRFEVDGKPVDQTDAELVSDILEFGYDEALSKAIGQLNNLEIKTDYKNVPEILKVFDTFSVNKQGGNWVLYDSMAGTDLETARTKTELVAKWNASMKKASKELALEGQQKVDKIKAFEGKDIQKAKGRIYKVELEPKDDEWLLLDKVLSAQSDKVIRAINKFPDPVKKIIDKAGGNIDGYHLIKLLGRAHNADSLASYFTPINHYWDKTTRKGVNHVIHQLRRDSDKQVVGEGSMKSEALHEAGLRGDRIVSEFLHSLGIRGNKYLSGESRNDNKKKLLIDGQDVANTTHEKVAEAAVIEYGSVEQALDGVVAIGNPEVKKILQGWLKSDVQIVDGSDYNFVLFSDRDVEIKEFFQAKRYQPRVPDASSNELVLPYGRVESELQNKLNASKGDASQLSSRRLGNVFGAPKKRKGKGKLDRNVKATSYPELKEMLDWAIANDHDGSWYDDFGKGFNEIVGEANLQEASILFGITSAQNAAETNFADTLHIMVLARRFNPLEQEQQFRNAVRNTPRPDGQRLKITGPQIDNVVRMYRSGTYRGGLKVSNYMQLVRARGENVFNPYSVQDVHMARAFGFRYRDIDKKTGNEVDAAKFHSSAQIRYGQWLTSLLSEEYEMRPDQVQAYLWFYAKSNLSPKTASGKKTKVGDGTYSSAVEYAQVEIDAINQQVADGLFDKDVSLTQALKQGESPNFKSGVVSDPYTNIDLNEQLEILAEARAPRLLVSTNPGNERGFGFPKGVTLDQLSRYNDAVIDAITDQDNQIILLREMGIVHNIRTTLGTWERIEPTIEITFPGESFETANVVANILGHALMQDATIVEKTKWEGQQFGVKVSKKDGSEYSNQDIADIYDSINPEHSQEGMNLTLTGDRLGIKILDNAYFENSSSYDTIALKKFFENIKNRLGKEFAYEPIALESEYHDHTRTNERNRSGAWDEGGTAGRPDLQRAAVHTLYKPVQRVYHDYRYKLRATSNPLRSPLGEIGWSGRRDAAQDKSWNATKLQARQDGRVNLVHWSSVDGIAQLDPSHQGEGAAGTETKRFGKTYLPRIYFGLEGYHKERQLGDVQYNASVAMEDLYDWAGDPIAIKARVVADNPGFTQAQLTNEIEQAIKEEGYKGYFGVNNNGPIAIVWETIETEQTKEFFQDKNQTQTTGNTGEFSANNDNIYNQEKRGSIQFRDSQTVISLFESADRSTFLHESGHFFLQVMQDLGEDVNAPENIKKDWQTILKFLEVESGDQIGTEQHEKWAESFEKYLFEGNAPSSALQDAFRRFKAWLTSVYKQLKNLNVEINDDIRGVFDRMLATEQEIKEAERAANYMPAFESAEQAGMSESEWNNYQKQANRATREAEDDLDRKKLSELTRERKRWWNEEREKVAGEVEQEVNQMPVYQAIHFLQTGEALGGELIAGVEPMKLDTKALTNEFGKILGQLPRGKEGIHVKKGGVHHDLVASLFGFNSGAEMIQAMIRAKKRQTLIAEMTTERMMQTFGDMLNDPQKIREEALKSAHMSDQRGRFLEMEIKALSKRANQKGTPANAAREAAKNIIGRKKVSQLHVGRLRAAELRAAKAAEKAILKEDWNEAIKQKRNQLLNHYLYREAEKAQQKVDRILRHLNKFQKPGVRKNLSRDYLDQIDTILEKFDLKKSVSLKKIQNRQSFAAWVKLQEANGDQVIVTPEMEKILEAAEKVHYKELSFEQLLDMDDLVKNIEHLARFKQKLIEGQQRREFREVVGELIGTAEQEHTEWKEDAPDFTNSKLKKFLDFGSRFLAEHEKVEFLAKFMDGEKDNGAWWRHIFKPISDAENAEMIMQEEFSKKLNKIFESRYTAKERMTWHKTVMTGHGVFNKRNILAMALNWGNIQNRSALVEGLQAKFGINEQAVQEILDAHMKQKDWEMVQETLDLINELWPQISQLQRELTGVVPKKVEAEPIVTKYGTYAGGYYPLKYDPKFSHKQELRSEKEGTQDLLESNWLKPVTKKGHTIERVGSGGQMVRLDLGVLSEHVTNVIHDLTHRKAVIQIDRLTQHDQVRAAIEGVAGKEAYRQIRPWLQGVANDHVPLTSNLEKGLAWARHGASIVAMGFKMTTALVQPLGYTQSIVLLGEKWAARGLKNFYRHPLDNRDAILKKSVFMRHRMETLDRDIRDSLNRISGEESRMKSMHAKYFMFIGWMDMTVSLPTWQGGYEKALSEGMNEKDAIAHADSMVRQSQAGGGVKDLAAIQRGHEGKKLFTLFYSYFSALFNMQKRTLRMRKEGRISNFEAFRHFVWLVALPAVLSEMLLGRAPDDDDEESMAEWTTKTILTYPFYSIVLVRDLVNYMANPQFGFSLPSADVAEGIGKGLAAIDDIWDDDEEFNEVDIKNMIIGISFALQLPGRQAANMYEHFHEVMEGEDFSLWEFLVKRDRND